MNSSQALAYAKLILNTQTNDLDDCWAEGYEASLNAATELDNPYVSYTKEFHYWQEGWWTGCYEETPAFETRYSLQDNIFSLIKQPNSKIIRLNYRRFFKKSLQFGSVAMIAAMGLELAGMAIANFGAFEIFAF